MRILVANLSHELNSFIDHVITLDEMKRYGAVAVGAAMFDPGLGTGRQMNAAQDIAAAQGIELIPSVHASARPGGPIADDAWAFLRAQIVEAARARVDEIDGVYLSLHGAMSSETTEDVEGDLLEHVRGVVGPRVPIVASFDLHVHMTDRIVRNADGVVVYRTYPHVDHYQTGERAMALLLDAVHGRTRPVVRHRKLRLMASAERQNTNQGPMVGVMELARAMEKRPGILSVSVAPTQPWMDVTDLGWSAIVVADGDADLAQTTADELAWAIWPLREAFRAVKTPVAEAVQQALATDGRPVVLSDSSDTPTGGANGDSDVLLRELLRIGYAGSALLTVTDPAAALAATAAGEGATLRLTLCGALSPQWFKPLEVTVRVEALRDGKFMLERPPAPFDTGKTAVLAVDGIRVVVSQSKAHHLDASIYHMAGLDPRTVDIVQVKSPGGFRAVYEPFAARIIEMDTPGPCASDLTHLPFKRRPSPMWPWDPDLQEPWPGAGSAGTRSATRP